MLHQVSKHVAHVNYGDSEELPWKHVSLTVLPNWKLPALWACSLWNGTSGGTPLVKLGDSSGWGGFSGIADLGQPVQSRFIGGMHASLDLMTDAWERERNQLFHRAVVREPCHRSRRAAADDGGRAARPGCYQAGQGTWVAPVRRHWLAQEPVASGRRLRPSARADRGRGRLR